MTTAAQPPLNIKERLLMPFMSAVQQVFEKMAGVKIVVKAPYRKTDAAATYDVCGIIGFTGEITGTVVVSFSDAAAENLVEAFSGAKSAVTDPDFADAIGELANMIAGGAKQKMGFSASITTPSVVIGKGYVVASIRSIPCLVIPCVSPYGDFAVEVSVKHNPVNNPQ